MSHLLQITDAARNVVWLLYRRFQLTRLETRTKEFIRMCEYVTQNGHMRNESERENLSSTDRLHSSA